MLRAVGQPEDEVLDRHGAQHAPADVDGRLRGRNEHRQLTLVRDLYICHAVSAVYMYMISREVKGTWDGTLGIMATNIWGLVGAPCSRNAWSCRANKQASVPDQGGTCMPLQPINVSSIPVRL
jgi:hypothetical protein